MTSPGVVGPPAMGSGDDRQLQPSWRTGRRIIHLTAAAASLTILGWTLQVANDVRLTV
jgi:hypothetical protein